MPPVRRLPSRLHSWRHYCAGLRRLLLAREGTIALSLGIAYAVLFSVLTVLRHPPYHSFGLDLALFDQVFWNTIHGRVFESTMSLGVVAPHSFFGDHLSPELFLIVPFYLAYPHPESLVVVQSVALALGGWPVYLLARAT